MSPEWRCPLNKGVSKERFHCTSLKKVPLLGEASPYSSLRECNPPPLPGECNRKFWLLCDHYCANLKTVNTTIIISFGMLLFCEVKANQMQDGKTASCNGN